MLPLFATCTSCRNPSLVPGRWILTIDAPAMPSIPPLAALSLRSDGLKAHLSLAASHASYAHSVTPHPVSSTLVLSLPCSSFTLMEVCFFLLLAAMHAYSAAVLAPILSSSGHTFRSNLLPDSSCSFIEPDASISFCCSLCMTLVKYLRCCCSHHLHIFVSLFSAVISANAALMAHAICIQHHSSHDMSVPAGPFSPSDSSSMSLKACHLSCIGGCSHC
jgi:hypothetical protein